MPKVSKPAIRTALIALIDAMYADQSIASQLRIENAVKEMSEALLTYDDEDTDPPLQK